MLKGRVYMLGGSFNAENSTAYQGEYGKGPLAGIISLVVGLIVQSKDQDENLQVPDKLKLHLSKPAPIMDIPEQLTH